MSIKHLPLLDNEKWYIIATERSEYPNIWQERQVSLHGPNSMASVEWSLLGKYEFGWGFQFGRNGDESDLGLNLYLGRLAKVWLRLRAPWTRWARISSESGDKNWHYARHTGIRIHPYEGCILSGELEALDGHWGSGDPWWRSWSITKHTILGKVKSTVEDGKTGEARIPLPEGIYIGTWLEKTYTTQYVGRLGKLRDYIFGPHRHSFVEVNVEGGIPVEGKGENSYDCGMDGYFGTSGNTAGEAIGNMVKAVLRDRERYGGPHDLPRPMTVSEAGARQREQ